MSGEPHAPLIRRAGPDDAPALAAVHAACWPAEHIAVEHIARALALPNRVTLAAVSGGTLAGFVDGFLTTGADGRRRWEVDLLAVHPAARGRGLGRRLIAACTTAGTAFRPDCIRALIRVDNVASQRAFAAAGFAPQAPICRLLVNTAGDDRGHEPPPGAHLVPVVTLTYRGVWIEGALLAEAFAAASDMRARCGWDIAGCVIPLEGEALHAAVEAGYTAVGDFAWWLRTPAARASIH
ncbi:MAG: GNAT family N-acetyltransferase [Anaerolineae bacterium]|nr:GNAT family N-acetyltransferase [Anaerolineae bacterium]